jgi:hypothetical protein
VAIKLSRAAHYPAFAREKMAIPDRSTPICHHLKNHSRMSFMWVRREADGESGG